MGEHQRILKRLAKNSQILQGIMTRGHVDIATVDFFQGREKDVIIVSCVRAQNSSSIGFVANTRRINVAITRARHILWVVGNEKTLKKSPDWKDLILDAKRRGCYFVSKYVHKFNTSLDQLKEHFTARE